MSDDSAQICRDNGWGPGTRLSGDAGYGVTVIEITAVGEHMVLAKQIRHNGVRSSGREITWTLTYLEWVVA